MINQWDYKLYTFVSQSFFLSFVFIGDPWEPLPIAVVATPLTAMDMAAPPKAIVAAVVMPAIATTIVYNTN